MPRPSRLLLSLCALIWLASLFGYWSLVKDKVASGQCDFLQFYTGAELYSSPGLFDLQANYAIHRRETGNYLPSIGFVRPPYYAFALAPLALLPYHAAYWLWMAINALSIAGALVLLGRKDPPLLALGVLYPAVYTSVLNGQDTGLLLLLASLACWLMRRDKDGAAGVVWALCSIKFHFLILIPVALWLSGKRRVLAAAIAAGAALLAICFAVQGLDWPMRYLALIRSDTIHPGQDSMPNFMLLVRLLGVDRLAGPAVATLLPLAVGVAAMLRLARWESRIAVALVAGLLAAPHVYLQDTLLLLPAFGLAHVEAPRMRAILAIALVPIVPLILLKGLPLSALLPALMLASLVAAIVAPRPPGPATSPAPAS